MQSLKGDRHFIGVLIHLAKLVLKKDCEAINCDEGRFGRIPSEYRVQLHIPGLHGQPTTNTYDSNPVVVLLGTGSSYREFLHVNDLADACIFLMNLPDDQFSSLLRPEYSLPMINIGCGNDSTIRELAILVRSIVGYEGEILWDAAKPDGTPRKLLDISRLTALGWFPRIDLETGVKTTYEWYLNQ